MGCCWPKRRDGYEPVGEVGGQRAAAAAAGDHSFVEHQNGHKHSFKALREKAKAKAVRSHGRLDGSQRCLLLCRRRCCDVFVFVGLLSGGGGGDW